MKNGTLNIEIFDILDEIAKKYNVATGKWADKSGFKHSARISELRLMVTMANKGNNPGTVGRAFTVQKCRMALDGLKFILGESIVTKELLALLKKAKTEKEKILIMVLAISQDKEVSLRMYLESLLESKSDN